MSRIDNNTLSQLQHTGKASGGAAYPDLTDVSGASGSELLQRQQQRSLEVMLVARLSTIQGTYTLIIVLYLFV
jgi:hypothetical protein